jgi:Arc/MetJ-type ribon-helix-helix transcriptional regulator
VTSRSEAVRRGLEALIEEHRREPVADDIVASYRLRPQTSEDVGWADEATRRMIADERW